MSSNPNPPNLNPPSLNPPRLNDPSLAEAITGHGFTRAAGFRVIAVEAGSAEVALARRDDLLQFMGHFHGGVITALADQAAGIAVTSGLPKGRIGVTVELKVNFLEPADGDELVARAKTLKMTGSLGVATIEVFTRDASSERLCAFATATMRALDLPAEFR
ncbi:MAG: putative esterase [Tardiphaga sp.]|nr:putative esterase [Tardiphaga sp.]